MPSISTCPGCQQEIAVPTVADPLQRLRCPLCEAHFPAYEVLAQSRPFPPEASPIESIREFSLSGPPAASEAAAGQGEAVQAVEPSGEWPLADAPAELEAWEDEGGAVWTIEPVETPRDAEGELSKPAPADAPAGLESDLELAPATLSPAPDEIPRTPAEQTPAEVLDDPSQAGEHDLSWAEPREAKPRPRAKHGAGFLGQLVGMLGGAVVGLSLGYYILLWIGGPRADFLGIRPRLPSWLVPAEREQPPADAPAYPYP